MLRYLFLPFFVLAIGLTSCAVWLAFFPKLDTAVFAVGETERDCGEVSVEPKIMTIRLTNQSTQPARILGFPPG